jgi:hypothetical protein
LASIFEPQVVRQPSAQNMSLCASGTPSSGVVSPAARRGVGGLRHGQGPVAVEGDEGVEFRVQLLDAVEEQRRQFGGGNLLLRQCGSEFFQRGMDHDKFSRAQRGSRLVAPASGAGVGGWGATKEWVIEWTFIR